jgi:hypothetical protein
MFPVAKPTSPIVPPFGWKPVKGSVTLDITHQAIAFLSENPPLNTIRQFGDYLLRIEPHPPDYARGLNDWHKGTTVYTRGIDSKKVGISATMLLGLGALWYLFRKHSQRVARTS